MSTTALQTPVGLRVALCRPKESTPVDRNQTAVALPSSASTTSGNTAAAPGTDTGIGAPQAPPAGLLEARTWLLAAVRGGPQGHGVAGRVDGDRAGEGLDEGRPDGSLREPGRRGRGRHGSHGDGEDGGGEEGGTARGCASSDHLQLGLLLRART